MSPPFTTAIDIIVREHGPLRISFTPGVREPYGLYLVGRTQMVVHGRTLLHAANDLLGLLLNEEAKQ